MNGHKNPSGLLLIAAVLALVGCSQADLSSVRITLNEDGSGTLVLVQTGVVEGKGEAASEKIRGVEWNDKSVQIACRNATFKRPENVDLAGIKLELKEKRLRVTVPLGPNAKWPDLLTPREKDLDELRGIAKREGLPIPPKGSWTSRFLVQVPGKIVAKGSKPSFSGGGGILSGGAEKENEAELLLPLGRVLQAEAKELVWEVTWE